MAPDIKTEQGASDHARPSTATDTSAAEAALKAKLSRKRTKTGCLTCRKRRIKCGEERPVCRNCIKSKRHCEGYNQRVVFKPPTFDYQPVPNGGAHITFQAAPVQIPPTPNAEFHAPVFDSSYTQLRPRPSEQQLVTVWDGQLQQYVTIEQPNPHFGPLHQPDHVLQPPTQVSHMVPITQGQRYERPAPNAHPVHAQHNADFVHHRPSAFGVHDGFSLPQHHQFQGSVPHTPADGHLAMPTTTLPAEYVAQAYDPGTHNGHHPPPDSFQHSQNASPNHAWNDQKPASTVGHDFVNATPLSTTSSRTMSFGQAPALPAQQQWTPTSEYVSASFTHSGSAQTIGNANLPAHQTSNLPTPQAEFAYPDFFEYAGRAPTYFTPTDVLTAAAVEVQDDDYYDVGSDEELDVEASPSPQQGQKLQRILSKMLAQDQITVRDLQVRRYDTFIYAGILDHYRVDEVASPLRNPATRRVFAHFISATGPSLSIFERHPRNTSVLFTEGIIPFSQQGLWTYTMPRAALRNQGLLHAMLALASLHIARLQNASVTPSMQHYSWALRRIHASVGKPQNRLNVTTIAASLLLGFYEIMTADHMKWNTHLAGSRQLFVETDFVKMAKEFRRLKLERAINYNVPRKRRHSSEEPLSQGSLLDQILDVDDRVVSDMIGRQVRYEDHGHVEAPHMNVPAGLDLGKFEILKDLYWWYCKQDVYQSVVSGNPLLMDFSRWGDCPPRAPLGRADAVYGSFDHLVLLLGRIADFACRDRERKLKQVEANGGQWKPSPGMNIPRPPPQAAPPPTPTSATNNGPPTTGNFAPPPVASPGGPNAMPQFYGMAPPPRANVHVPSTYTPFLPQYSIPTPQSAHGPDAHEYDLPTETTKALEEYGRIRAALHTFSISLGHAFEPLSPEFQTPMNTPFGTALFYRSYDIGCLWAVYNMAMIIAIRSHPYMPPAAHVAAGIAAQDTSYYANEIGRIAAGIVPGPPDQPLNPSLGAALCESCMPSFFAAVQYRSLEQRHSTVLRIYSIAKRTGWGSAELIANGCETAWVKAAAVGRGPPYDRIVRPQEPNEDPRLNGSWERLDPNGRPDETDDTDRRLVRKKANARLNWAIGVMGVEEDVKNINISD